MSNALHKRRMAELAARRMANATPHIDERPVTFNVTAVAVRHTGTKVTKAGNRRKVFTSTVRMGERTNAPYGAVVDVRTGFGERPGYMWTGIGVRSGDAPCRAY